MIESLIIKEKELQSAFTEYTACEVISTAAVNLEAAVAACDPCRGRGSSLSPSHGRLSPEMSSRCVLLSQCLDQMLHNGKTSITSFLYSNDARLPLI